MSIQPTSLNNNVFNQAGFNVPAIKPNYQTPKISTEVVKDSIELSNKKSKNKKIALAFLGIAGIVGATIGLVLAIRKGKVPNKEINAMTQEASELAQNVQDEASKIYQKMRKMGKEVNSLYNAVQKPNYKGTAKLTNGILEEFDDAGNLIRKSEFTDDLLDFIEEYSNGRTDKYIYMSGTTIGDSLDKMTKSFIEPESFQKGIEKMDDGGEKIQEEFEFLYGKINIFRSNITSAGESKWQSEKELSFINDDISSFNYNHICCEDEDSFEKKLIFFNNQPCSYIEDSQDFSFSRMFAYSDRSNKWKKVNSRQFSINFQ